MPYVDTLGEYIEHKLPTEEWDSVEKHLRSCLYCLNQLVELRELLFLEENAEPLPRALERRLRRLATQETQSILVTWLEVSKEYTSAALETARAIFNSRYTWQTVSVVILAIMLFRYPGLIPKKPEDDTKRIAKENRESNVNALKNDASGTIVGEGAKLLTVPLGVFSRIGRKRSQINQVTAQRIVSVLQSLGKTLILEQTRGVNDVKVYEQAAPLSFS